MAHPYKILIPLSSFDRKLLPNPEISQEELPVAVHEYLSESLSGQGVDARLVVSKDTIRVEWGRTQEDLLKAAVQLLTNGKYPEGILILRGIVEKPEAEPSALYNLGMALSDIGELVEAIDFLSQYLRLRPDDLDAKIALGVAYARNSEEAKAIEVLESACKEFPENALAHRNHGGALLRSGRFSEAVGSLRIAVALDSTDAGSWLGLGQALSRLAEGEEADRAFRKVLEIDSHSGISEVARTELTRLAEKKLRANSAGLPRPDAVMYCLAALQRFRHLSDKELMGIFAELATTGERGYDINNSDKRYHFDSLSGDFTGLQAVSYMFVAGDRLLPGQNIGIDLSVELSRAKALFNEGNP